MSQLLHTFIASLLSVSAPATEQTTSWTPSVMMDVKSVSETAISPDNKSILFVEADASIDGPFNREVQQVIKK